MNSPSLAAVGVLLQVDLDFDGIQDFFADGIELILGSLAEGILGTIGDIVVKLFGIVMVPPLPPDAEAHVPASQRGLGTQFGDALWGGPVAMNVEMTQVALSLFSVVLLLYIIAGGVGYLKGDVEENAFKAVFGLIVLVTNKELLDLFYAGIYTFSWAILDGSSLFGETGLGYLDAVIGNLITGFVLITTGTLGYGFIIGQIILVISVIIGMIMMLINVVGMIGYGIFPLLVLTYLLGEITSVLDSWHQKVVGFFIPPMYAPILFAIVFRFAAFFMDKGMGVSRTPNNYNTDPSAALQQGVNATAPATTPSGTVNIFEAMIGPFLFVAILFVGVWVIIKNMKAGSAIVSGLTTTAKVAGTAALVAATGGAGAAATGAAGGGGASNAAASSTGGASNAASNAANSVGSTVGSGPGSGPTPDPSTAANTASNIADQDPQQGMDSQQIIQGGLRGAMHGGGLSGAATGVMFEAVRSGGIGGQGSAISKFANVQKDAVSKLNNMNPITSGAKKAAGAVTDYGENPEELTEEITDDEEIDAHGERRKDHRAALEEWDEQADKKKDQIKSGALSSGDVKSELELLSEALEDQGGVTSAQNEYNALEYEYEAQRQQIGNNNPEMDQEEINAEAWENAINERVSDPNSEIDERELGTLAMARISNGNIQSKDATGFNPYDSQKGMASQLNSLDEDDRHEYLRNMYMAGSTTDKVDPFAEHVEFGEVSSDPTKKEERMGMSMQETSSPPATTDMEIVDVDEDSGEVAFTGDIAGMEEIQSIESLSYDSSNDQLTADVGEFTEAMAETDLSNTTAVASRDDAMKLERHNRVESELMETQIRDKLEQEMGADTISESINNRVKTKSSQSDQAETIVEDTLREVDVVVEEHFEGSFNTNIDGVSTPTLTEADLDRMGDENSVVDVEGELEPSNISTNNQGEEVYQVTTSVGEKVDVRVEGEDAVDQIEQRLKQSSGNNETVRIKNAGVESNVEGVSRNRIKIDEQTTVQTEKEVEVDNNLVTSYFNNTQGVGEAELREAKKGMDKSDKAISSGDVAERAEKMVNDLGASDAEIEIANNSNLSRPQTASLVSTVKQNI